MRSVTIVLGLALLLSLDARAQTPPRAPEAPAVVASPTVATTTSKVAARYALLFDNGSPFIDVALGPKARGLFLVDTGANASAIDEAWVEEQTLPWKRVGTARVKGTTGSATFTKAELERLDLGNGLFLAPRFNLQDVARFGPVEGHRRVGRLGTDYLACFALTFDWAAKTLDVAFRNERRPADGGKTIPLSWPKNLPTVTARLGGLEVECRLDTGARYRDQRALLDVGPAAVQALREKGVKLRETGTIRMKGVTGSDKLEVLEAEGLVLELGPVKITPVVLVLHDKGTLAGKAPLVLAGMPIISRLGKRLTFDPFDLVLRVED